MDLAYDQSSHQPAIHYERVVLTDYRSTLIDAVKKNAFGYMTELEGWCTNNKAAILIDLVFLFQPKVIVEIGVFGGKSLVPMATALKVTSKGKIYGIDPWSSAASAEGMDGVNYEWWSTLDHVAILRGLQEKLFLFDLENHVKLIQSTSENASIIENIDFLHVDGNHSEKASLIDVYKWVPLVRKGGLIIFDDITWSSTTGTNAAAVQWLDENCIRLVELHDTGNDWGIWVKP